MAITALAPAQDVNTSAGDNFTGSGVNLCPRIYKQAN